jgi:hypothetical protein
MVFGWTLKLMIFNHFALICRKLIVQSNLRFRQQKDFDKLQFSFFRSFSGQLSRKSIIAHNSTRIPKFAVK